MTRYGFLGPEGTFCEMALRQWAASHEGDHHPFGSVGAALRALREGRIDAAMVPIENSVEGGVSATLDALSVGEQLHIIGEVLVPITFVLAARP
ncbi:MAG: prephenate dehydratase, partial [Dermatophilaceae bacterium]|nr:prephenate dehydratase [Dermatophilaceae bacterium]